LIIPNEISNEIDIVNIVNLGRKYCQLADVDADHAHQTVQHIFFLVLLVDVFSFGVCVIGYLCE